MQKRFIRKLIDVEIKLGFLHIPAAGIEMMPDKDGKIAVLIDGKDNELTYNAKHKRVFGLVRWYSGASMASGGRAWISLCSSARCGCCGGREVRKGAAAFIAATPLSTKWGWGWRQSPPPAW